MTQMTQTKPSSPQAPKPSDPQVLPSPPAAEARPASTVIVVRPVSGTSFEVLMVKRNDQMAFMAGAYVFPGGRVDAADAVEVEDGTVWSTAPRFPELSVGEELAHLRAGVRELAEEASVQITVNDLVAFAHWVTPAVEIRRYDTRFYLARMPDGQEARHDDNETTEFAWLTPAHAIARCQRQEITLPSPTWTTLRQLERFATADEAFAWARTKPIVRVEPGFIKDQTTTMLTLPGDPLHPTIPGWEVPEETRFVLEEGRGWVPKKVQTE